MNLARKLCLYLAVVGFSLTMTAACSQSSGGGSGSSNNFQGNVSAGNGNIVSNDSVNGQAMSVTVSGLQMTNNNNYYSGYSNTGSINAQVTVNGLTQAVQTSIASPGTQAQGVYLGRNQAYVMYSTARCIDSTCTNVALVMWFNLTQYNSSQYQYKQVGMIQNLSNGSIRAAIEQVGYLAGYGMTPSLPTADALVSSLQSIMK